MSCKYCKPHESHLKHIQDTCLLHRIGGTGKEEPFVKVEMQTGGDIPASLRVVSASENKYNQMMFDINFCPMCGQNLAEYINKET